MRRIECTISYMANCVSFFIVVDNDATEEQIKKLALDKFINYVSLDKPMYVDCLNCTYRYTCKNKPADESGCDKWNG